MNLMIFVMMVWSLGVIVRILCVFLPYSVVVVDLIVWDSKLTMVGSEGWEGVGVISIDFETLWRSTYLSIV